MAWRPIAGEPPTILLVSVLDSVEHPRLRHRQALTLSHRYVVHLAACGPATHTLSNQGMVLHPFAPVGHRSWRRIARLITLIRLLRRLKPKVAHLHSIELLLPALLLRPTGCLLVYDRHESYPRNIRYGTHWPRLLRRPLEMLVHRYEQWAGRRVDGVIYAEAAFAGELPARRTVVIENRYCGQINPQHIHERPQTPAQAELLVSGTVALEWGLLRALELWRLWNTHEPARLAVVGRCRDADLAQTAFDLARRWGLTDRLHWDAPPHGVPFDRIESAIEACSLGLALYVLSPARADRIPSKFYEFMAWRKPLAFTAHPPWTALNAKWQFGVGVPDGPPPAALVAELVAQHRRGFPDCHPQPIPPTAWHWQSQGEKLVAFYDELLLTTKTSTSKKHLETS